MSLENAPETQTSAFKESYCDYKTVSRGTTNCVKCLSLSAFLIHEQIFAAALWLLGKLHGSIGAHVTVCRTMMAHQVVLKIVQNV